MFVAEVAIQLNVEKPKNTVNTVLKQIKCDQGLHLAVMPSPKLTVKEHFSQLNKATI